MISIPYLTDQSSLLLHCLSEPLHSFISYECLCVIGFIFFLLTLEVIEVQHLRVILIVLGQVKLLWLILVNIGVALMRLSLFRPLRLILFYFERSLTLHLRRSNFLLPLIPYIRIISSSLAFEDILILLLHELYQSLLQTRYLQSHFFNLLHARVCLNIRIHE